MRHIFIGLAESCLKRMYHGYRHQHVEGNELLVISRSAVDPFEITNPGNVIVLALTDGKYESLRDGKCVNFVDERYGLDVTLVRDDEQGVK